MKTRLARIGGIIYLVTQTIGKVEEGKTHYIDFWGIPSSEQRLSKLDFCKSSFFSYFSKWVDVQVGCSSQGAEHRWTCMMSTFENWSQIQTMSFSNAVLLGETSNLQNTELKGFCSSLCTRLSMTPRGMGGTSCELNCLWGTWDNCGATGLTWKWN